MKKGYISPNLSLFPFDKDVILNSNYLYSDNDEVEITWGNGW